MLPVHPWRGRSAADATELMNIGWQYAREHLDPIHRSAIPLLIMEEISLM